MSAAVAASCLMNVCTSVVGNHQCLSGSFTECSYLLLAALKHGRFVAMLEQHMYKQSPWLSKFWVLSRTSWCWEACVSETFMLTSEVVDNAAEEHTWKIIGKSQFFTSICTSRVVDHAAQRSQLAKNTESWQHLCASWQLPHVHTSSSGMQSPDVLLYTNTRSDESKCISGKPAVMSDSVRYVYKYKSYWMVISGGHPRKASHHNTTTVQWLKYQFKLLHPKLVSASNLRSGAANKSVVASEVSTFHHHKTDNCPIYQEDWQYTQTSKTRSNFSFKRISWLPLKAKVVTSTVASTHFGSSTAWRACSTCSIVYPCILATQVISCLFPQDKFSHTIWGCLTWSAHCQGAGSLTPAWALVTTRPSQLCLNSPHNYS